MKRGRLVRINELLKREISEELFRLLNESNFDVAAITVTRVEVSPDLRTARVFVSIRGHKDERAAMLEALGHHSREIQRRINKDITIKYTPRLSFELDTSIERGDHVLQLLSQLEKSDDKKVTE